MSSNMSKQEVEALLSSYSDRFTDSEGELLQFKEFAGEFEGDELYNRKNFTGHITASAIIADRSMTKMLLLAHKQLGKWLQPGGHVESTDAGLLEAAFREVEEETGLSCEDYDVMVTADGVLPFGFDSHHIPPCAPKAEEEHYHHDIRFLFRLKGEAGGLQINRLEADGYKWVTREEFSECFGSDRLMSRIDEFTKVF